MTSILHPTKKSGTKEWRILTSDNPRELERISKRLNEPIHGKGQQEPHIDVPARKVARAIVLGAVPLTILCCAWYYLVLVPM